MTGCQRSARTSTIYRSSPGLSGAFFQKKYGASGAETFSKKGLPKCQGKAAGLSIHTLSKGASFLFERARKDFIRRLTFIGIDDHER